MRIDTIYIENFKNLKKFSINLDETQMNTVFLGQNATGKSNLLEALVLIFKYLDLSGESKRLYPEFKYSIQYYCRQKKINIYYLSEGYDLKVDDVSASLKKFFSKEGKKEFLPKYVFTYYSGLSDRLDRIFWDHQNNFYKKIIKKGFDKVELDELRRLFYVKQIHSFFVLLAFFSLPQIEEKSKAFLTDVLGIEDLESVLFILKKPSWKNQEGDERFWGAEGLVQQFLSILWDYTLAPIYNTEKVYPDFRSKGVDQERLYLYISDKDYLKKFASEYFNQNKEIPTNTFLFKALESTYISELLEEVKVKVRKKVDGEITFKELSEGEQQLLTVIGLLIFTKEDESLVLLDEPDTHLNPVWKYDYLHFLKTLVKTKKDNQDNSKEEDLTTQILINTHDPLVIGSMEKSQVRLFGRKLENDNHSAIEPDTSPKGMGVAGILMSELFGLKSIIDRDTQKLLDERNQLMYKESKNQLSEIEKHRLQDLFEELSNLGFNHTFKDPLYSEFIVKKMDELNQS